MMTTARTRFFDGAKSYPVNVLSDEGWTYAGSDDKSEGVSKYYKAVGVLYRCVQVRANAVRRMPWHVLKGDKAVWQSTDRQVLKELQFASDLRMLIGKTEMALILAAQAFWYKEQNRAKVLDLKWFSPLTIVPKWDKQSGLIGYERSLNGLKLPLYAPEEIVYFWYQDALHETLPDVAPAQVALAAAGVLYNTKVFVSTFMERGAIKATLLTVEGNPAPQEKARLKEWWKRFFSGIQNAGSAEVVSAGVKPVVIGEGLSELSNTDLTGENREEIATTLGIPHSMVFSNSANFATSSQDKLNFYDETVIPECELIQHALNEQLFNALGYSFEFLPNSLDIYQEDEQQRAASWRQYVDGGMKPSIAAEILGIELPQGVEYDSLDEQPVPIDGTEQDGQKVANILGYHVEQGVVTRNEARAELNLPPVDESQDEKLRNLRALLDIVTIAKGAGFSLEAAVQLAGLPVAGIDVSEPEPQPTQRTPIVGRDKEPESVEEPASKRAADLDKWRRKAHKRLSVGKSAVVDFTSDYLSDIDIGHYKFLLSHAETPEQVDAIFGGDGINADFFTKATPDLPGADGSDKQRAKLERLHTDKIHDALLTMRRKIAPLGTTVENITPEIAVSRLRENSNLLRDAMVAMLLDGAHLGAEIGIAQVEKILGVGKATITGVNWDLVNEAVYAWVTGTTGGGFGTGYTDETGYADTIMMALVQSSEKQIRHSIGEWVNNGLSFNDLVTQLERSLFSRDRAQRIATTEISRSYYEGNLAAYRQGGIIKKVRFNSSQDEKVCPLCGPLNGVTAELDEAFRHPNGATYRIPVHVMCRCWISPVSNAA